MIHKHNKFELVVNNTAPLEDKFQYKETQVLVTQVKPNHYEWTIIGTRKFQMHGTAKTHAKACEKARALIDKTYGV